MAQRYEKYDNMTRETAGTVFDSEEKQRWKDKETYSAMK